MKERGRKRGWRQRRERGVSETEGEKGIEEGEGGREGTGRRVGGREGGEGEGERVERSVRKRGKR